MILFVDNEKARTSPWVEELKDAEFEVELIVSADKARQALEAPDLPECIVLDVMIPADGDVPDRETAYGTRTGLWLLEQLRKEHPNTPVIVLTNVDDPGVEDTVKDLNAVYQHKKHCGPSNLVELVRSLTQ